MDVHPFIYRQICRPVTKYLLEWFETFNYYLFYFNCYKRVLEDTGVGVMGSNMVDETKEPGKNTEHGRASIISPALY